MEIKYKVLATLLIHFETKTNLLTFSMECRLHISSLYLVTSAKKKKRKNKWNKQKYMGEIAKPFSHCRFICKVKNLTSDITFEFTFRRHCATAHGPRKCSPIPHSYAMHALYPLAGTALLAEARPPNAGRRIGGIRQGSRSCGHGHWLQGSALLDAHLWQWCARAGYLLGGLGPR